MAMILAIDADSGIAMSLKDILQAAGHTVIVTGSLDQTDEMIQRFGLIVTADTIREYCDGLDWAETRSDQKPPVVVMCNDGCGRLGDAEMFEGPQRMANLIRRLPDLLGLVSDEATD